MKILFCHDGSENSQKALDQTLELFQRVKPEVMLLTVVEFPHDASMENEDIYEKWQTERRQFLKTTAQYVSGKGFEVDAILATGDARKMILDAAEKKKPDMLIVAKRGGGLIDNMALGSVSAYLIRHAHCPVLVFHTR